MTSPVGTAQRDGQRDFDFHIGTWTTHLKRLQNPLSGSKTWLDYEGTTTVREVLNGRANLVELSVNGPAGRIEGLMLRLYNPEARQWTLNFANIANGILTPPTVGAFNQGRGEFYSQETFNGRAILVRFVISDITPTSCHFEQAFSADGGKTWETNWIATDTRPSPPPAADADTPDSVIRRMYEVLSGKAGDHDWRLFASLFHGNAVMGATRMDPQGRSIYRSETPREYMERNAEFFRARDFYVNEIHRTTEEFGEIVHAFSTYEFRSEGGGPSQRGRGINSIQLVRDANRWWIVSVQFTNERPDLPIPKAFGGV